MVDGTDRSMCCYAHPCLVRIQQQDRSFAAGRTNKEQITLPEWIVVRLLLNNLG